MPVIKMTLKALRINMGINQIQAAEMLEISVDTLQNWEKGKTYPDVKQIMKIEKVYGVPYEGINFLVTDSV